MMIPSWPFLSSNLCLSFLISSRKAPIHTARFENLSELGKPKPCLCLCAERLLPEIIIEVQVLKELAQLKSKHKGQMITRAVLDSFEIAGPSGRHICLVHKTLLMSLHSFQFLSEEKILPMRPFKAAIYDVLLALDYLHSEADMIYTDIQANNIMLSSKVPQVFSRLLEAKESEPSLRKTNGGINLADLCLMKSCLP
ncbi:hypothetical protein BDV97DRAFT_390872 [Delphinella strobiligena]|nr:hypothetical protein BDV97DRAFT_390872 [Delphinella strobiligena]